LDSHITAYLLEVRYAVTVFDKLLHGARVVLPLNRQEGSSLMRGDVRDRDIVAGALSAFSDGVNVWRNPCPRAR
jgi:UDP-glucose 4-epimerase